MYIVDPNDREETKPQQVDDDNSSNRHHKRRRRRKTRGLLRQIKGCLPLGGGGGGGGVKAKGERDEPNDELEPTRRRKNNNLCMRLIGWVRVNVLNIHR